MARKYGVKASAALQRQAARLVRDLGVREAATALNIGEESVTRIAAGACVHKATLLAAESAVARASRTRALASSGEEARP